MAAIFHARHDHGLHAWRRPCTGVAARIPKASSGECVIKPEKAPASCDSLRGGRPQRELAKAEDLIQKRDYAQAESVLQKLVASDSENDVAWFDLGFVENALGKPQDSIAAYRKSVAAKPNVFESNLNLGLQLAKTGQGDAEKFLRAATQLTPTSHVAEGQARAWLSLAHLLEPTKPEESIAAYQHAADLLPKDLEPHLSAGLLLEEAKQILRCRAGVPKRVSYRSGVVGGDDWIGEHLYARSALSRCRSGVA